MKIYEYAGTPNRRRVCMFLAEKGLEVEYVPVDITKGEKPDCRISHQRR